MNTEPVSRRVTSPAAAADSIRSTEVSLRPLTVLAKGSTPSGPEVIVGTQAPPEMPWSLQNTRKPW